ncbi:uncharacterized protein LOC121873936 [Homarus americanus]|uniref:uncharacterized protein LOC121873936 n=1 Tax=Homarus americanus TaxID=6706 RepID=UPI001C45F658|nr:uncharacterized protein LOC121873936 [Homarus americanus]
MVPPCYRALLIAALMMSVPLVISREADGPLKHRSVDVGLVVAQTMKHHLTSCQVILITTSQHSHVFSSVLRHTSMYLEASLVVEAGLVFSQDQLAQDHLLQGLWGDSKTTCRALILDLTINTNNTQLILSLLEAAGMWQLPETRVVVVGLARRAGVKAILLHHSFRNTAHVLYLAMHYPTLHILPRHGHLRLNKVIQVHAEYIRVRIYRRCLYCNNGEADVQPVLQENITSTVELCRRIISDNEHLQDMKGHKFFIVTRPYFPYMDYKPDTDDPETLITARDSLDIRVLNTLAVKLNSG